MTVYPSQYYNAKDLICRRDLTKKKTRCAGCEITKRYTKYSKSFPCPQTTWRHIHQCPSFNLISYPKREDVVIGLESICIAIRNNSPLEDTLGFKLGMVVS
jgi:hypothetical protein